MQGCTHKAVEVEDTVPLVNCGAAGLSEGPSPLTDVRREGPDVAAEEEEELRDVESEELAPPAVHGLCGFVRPVRASDDHSTLGVPPGADVLGRALDLVEVIEDVLCVVRLLDLAQAVGGLYAHLDLKDEAGRAEAALRRAEQLGVGAARHAHDGRARQRQHDEQRHDVLAHDRVAHARAVGRRRDQPRNRLVADAAQVAQRLRRAVAHQRRVHRVQRCAGAEVGRLVRLRDLMSACSSGSSPLRCPAGAPLSPRTAHKHGLTSSDPFRPCIRTSHPLVHPRSDGECPTPTGCTLLPSLRASSMICRHCSAERGAYTRSGWHSNVRAQFVKKADDRGSMSGARFRCSRSVETFSRSVVSDAGTLDCGTGNAALFGGGAAVGAGAVGVVIARVCRG